MEEFTLGELRWQMGPLGLEALIMAEGCVEEGSGGG